MARGIIPLAKSRKYVVFLVFFLTLFSSGAQAAQIPFFTNYPAIDTKTWMLSDGWTNGDIQACEWRAKAVSAHDNAIQITLSDVGGQKRPYGCGEMQTKQFTSFGSYEVRMKTAAGPGLNSNFFTYIGPPNGVASHDEIDFEFLGKDPHTVQLNYWVDGKSSDGTVIQLGFDASQDFHNYSFVWEKKRIRWYIDGKLVHETKPGATMPTHPSHLFISLWAGSKLENDWLGEFNYQNPVAALFAWVKYTPLPQ